MAKNFMPEIAKILGAELGEEFIIENVDRKENVVISLDGFHVIQPNNVLGPDHGKLLSKVLQGLYEIKKKPWEPEEGERFFYPDPQRDNTLCANYTGCLTHLALKSLGMIYRTRKEADAHYAEDCEKLTGKKLSK